MRLSSVLIPWILFVCFGHFVQTQDDGVQAPIQEFVDIFDDLNNVNENFDEDVEDMNFGFISMAPVQESEGLEQLDEFSQDELDQNQTMIGVGMRTPMVEDILDLEEQQSPDVENVTAFEDSEFDNNTFVEISPESEDQTNNTNLNAPQPEQIDTEKKQLNRVDQQAPENNYQKEDFSSQFETDEIDDNSDLAVIIIITLIVLIAFLAGMAYFCFKRRRGGRYSRRTTSSGAFAETEMSRFFGKKYTKI